MIGARCILAARGIEPTAEAMAGALIELDTHHMIQGFIMGLAGGSK